MRDGGISVIRVIIRKTFFKYGSSEVKQSVQAAQERLTNDKIIDPTDQEKGNGEIVAKVVKNEFGTMRYRWKLPNQR